MSLCSLDGFCQWVTQWIKTWLRRRGESRFDKVENMMKPWKGYYKLKTTKAQVVFLEDAVLYDRLFPIPDEVLNDDFVLPIGKCKIEREGNDITIVSYAKGVGKSLDAANELDALGISTEVINLRTLRPLDFETIKNSVMKTRHLVTVEEGWPFAGMGAEISAQVSESEVWDYLKAPILRVCGADVPMPYAQHLEEEVIPNVTHIVTTCEKSLNHKSKK